MSDLIGRTDAIEAVMNNARATVLYSSDNTGVLDILHALPSANADWTPCKKGLPKENGEYIVSLEDSVYPWAKFFNGKWFMLSMNAIAREFGEYEVIAWMPLPKPYREDGEE